MAVLGTAIGTAFWILALIKGWGLEPVNWWWIIGGGVGGIVLGKMISFSRHD